MLDKLLPQKIKPARAWRTYIGGKKIDELHGILNGEDSHYPEEWLMSVVSAFNPDNKASEEGLSYLVEKNISLKDYLQEDSVLKLGDAHVRKYGQTPGVLLKIIDTAERLTIQVHPNKDKARYFFNSPFGKTECWHILGGRTIHGEKPSIYIGFKKGITKDIWKKNFECQDIQALLGMMHHIAVKPGDTYLIEGGMPHAIGCGCFLMEIQEPTDYTFRIERTTPNGLMISDQACHLGIGFENMFDCFDYSGFSEEEIIKKTYIKSKCLEKTDQYLIEEIIGYEDSTCFRLDKITIFDSFFVGCQETFSGLYVISGQGMLITKTGKKKIEKGDQFFVPAYSVDMRIITEDIIIIFRFNGPDFNNQIR